MIDASNVLAGPVAGQILADFGADVVKIEHPTKPDGLRQLGRSKDGEGLWWKVIARNKRNIALDLSSPDGAEICRKLSVGADVLIENFRPSTMESWGLGYQSLSADNPGLVMLRITGFGQTGPYANRPAFGTLIEAMSGFAMATGQPDGEPTLPPLGLADTMAGLSGALGVVMALYHRDARGGAGQQIDVSILEPLVSVMSPQPTVWDQLGQMTPRLGNQSDLNAPRNLYKTSDSKWIAMSSSTFAIAKRVMACVGHPEVVEEKWFADGQGRVEHSAILDNYVAQWVAGKTRAEAIAEFEKAQAAVGPVYDVAELMADPHVIARGIFETVDDEQLGRVKMPGLLMKMGETPGSIRHTGRRHGCDTDEVLGELGISQGELEALRAKGVIA